MSYPIQKTEAQWRELLAQKGAEPIAFDVTRRAHTDRPFTGNNEPDSYYHLTLPTNRPG